MPLSDLDVIPLPDLTGPEYPVVDHIPLCVEPAAPALDCWPESLPEMQRVRPFAHPQSPLGRLRFSWMRIRNLFPAPPSVGVHCPTVRSTQTQVIVSPNPSPQWNRSIEQPPEDACRINIRDVLQIPCILPTFQDGEVFGTGGVVIGTVEAVVQQNGCNQQVRFDVTIGDVEVEGAAAGRFQACLEASWDWAATRACIDAGEATAPGEELDVAIDLDGSVGDPGQTIGSEGDIEDTVVLNVDDVPIVCGDLIRVVKIVVDGDIRTYHMVKA